MQTSSCMVFNRIKGWVVMVDDNSNEGERGGGEAEEKQHPTAISVKRTADDDAENRDCVSVSSHDSGQWQ